MGLVLPRPVGSSWARDRPHASRIGRQILSTGTPAIGVHSPPPLELPSCFPPSPTPLGCYRETRHFKRQDWCLYQRPIAAITNFHKWLKATKISYLLILEDRSRRIGFSGLKSRSSGCMPSTNSRGESIPLPFPAS